MDTKYTTSQVLDYLRNEAEILGQKKLSAHLGFSPQFINDVLAGRRFMTENLTKALGFEKLPDSYIRNSQSSNLEVEVTNEAL